jgi:hypothetical protein
MGSSNSRFGKDAYFTPRADVAVVEGSKDGRWLAIGTRKRAIHVFPVNTYGGKADIG